MTDSATTGPSWADALHVWVRDLHHAGDWATGAIPLWIKGEQSWPPAEDGERTAVEERIRVLAEAKARWTHLASPQLLKRFTPEQRDTLYSCLDYFELAGLRLRQAYASGDVRHLRDALGDLQPGQADFRGLAATVFGLADLQQG